MDHSTPYDEEIAEVRTASRHHELLALQEGYRRGIATTEARYAKLVEACRVYLDNFPGLSKTILEQALAEIERG